MLLPKRVTRKYTYDYDRNSSEIKVYSSSYMDKAVRTIFMRNREDCYTSIRTTLAGNKIEHVLTSLEIERNINEEEYRRCIQIIFSRLKYQVVNITAIIDYNGDINYEVELCKLVRKISNNNQKILRKGKV